MDNTIITLLVIILILSLILSLILLFYKSKKLHTECKLTPNRYNYTPQPNIPISSLLSQGINYMNLGEFNSNIAGLDRIKEKFATINGYNSDVDKMKTQQKQMTKKDENIFNVPRYNMIECEGPNCGANMTGPYPLPCDDSKKDKSVFIKCSNICNNNNNNKTVSSLNDIDPETLKILLMNKYITAGLEVIDRE